MSPPVAPTALPPDLVAMMARGVSVIVSSCDAQCRPSLMRAVGSHVEPEGLRLTVYLARSQAAQLLQDIQTSGQLAAVFSQPSTHRSVQIKARGAVLRPADAQDQPVLECYQAAMAQELSHLHIPVALTRALLAHHIDDVVAVSFTPEEAYDQTPGPRAGAALEARP